MWEDTLSFQNQQYTEKSGLLQKQNRNNSFDITITKKEQSISEFNIEYTQLILNIVLFFHLFIVYNLN